jgi:hypothetical protein
MAILTTGNSYSDGNQITSSNLNAIVNSATFSDPVDTSSGLNLTSDSPPKIAINTSLSNKVLTGGSLNNCPIGAATPSTGVFTTLTATGNLDIDGIANLDAVDIDGAVQLDSTLTVGVNGTGYDVKFFGATSGAYIQFDASADKLLTAGGATVDIVKDKLLIGGTAVTTTAAELNVLDGVTAGTVTASKGIVVDSNKDIASFRNITLTGELDAGSLDVSGDIDVDGTTNLDAVDIDGAVDMASTLTVSGDVTVDTTTLKVDSSNNRVGIGTASPSKSLVVNENDSECVIVVNSSDSGTAGIYFGDQSDEIVGGVVFDNSTDKLELRSSNNNTAVTIDNSERVGIGTASPSTTLDVNGTATVSGDTVLNSDLEINVSGASNSSKGIVVNSSGTNFESDAGLIQGTHAGSGSLTGGYWLKFNANSADKFTVKGNGDTDISGELTVKGGGSGSIVVNDEDSSLCPTMTFLRNGAGTTTNDFIKFENSAGEVGSINATGGGYFSGNVGLNNSGPSVRLEIGDGTGTSDHVYHNKSGSGAFPGITNTTSHGIMLESQGANGSTLHVSRTNSAAGNFSRQGTGDVVTFHNTSSSVTEAGSIEITGATSVLYQTSSDYRLKENLVSISDGIDRVKQLKPLKFNFINEPRIVDGFLAHEVSDIVPEAIGGEKDAMKDQEYEVSPAVYNEEGELVTEAVIGTRSVPDYQGIDQSKLVPLLTAALQEAVAKIEALEARVQTLEG